MSGMLEHLIDLNNQERPRRIMTFNNPFKFVWLNSVSLMSLFIIALNLGFWMAPTFLLATAKKILNKNNKARESIISCIQLIYIAAAKINNFWIRRILKINIRLKEACLRI